MIACLAAFAIVGVALVAAGGRPGPRVFLVGAVPMALSFAWVVSQLDGVLSGGSPEQSYIWIGQLGLTLDLRLDGFGATMSLIVTGIGVLVMVYAHRYFGATTPDMGRLAGLLVLFSGAMVGLVQADHLLLVYVCWEITSITSYLLIGHNHTDPGARAAALHALLVTGAGGLAMLGGFVVLGQAAGTYRISEILAGPRPTGTAVTVALALILVGAFTKSAQYPFHSWLPGAMAAPTPVSAYLHSATMVKAGVYLIARLAPMFAATVIWQPAVIVIGLLTMIAGGLRALRQNDLKLLLAFGTVSQLGFMVVLFGLGTPEADLAGWLLLVSHALFKAALFMVVGVIDHDTGTRDIRELPVFGARWRWLEVATALSLASMAGVPFLSGFIAKEAAYGALEVGIEGSRWLVLAGLVAGSMLTVAYGYRFYRGAFLDARRCAAAGAGRSEIEAPAFGFGWPVALLAAVSLAVGVLPAFLDDIASVAVGSLIGADEAVHLSLWHGLNLPLALSAVTLVGGVVLCVADRRVQPLLATGRGIPTGEAAYLVLLRGMTATARRVTGVVQNGSLPVYAGIILLTVAVTPAVPLLADWDWPGWPELTRTAEVPVAAMLLLSALGAAVVRRRFSAAIFLGAAGYSMAALFVVYGAPDLALTQAAIETLATVVFVLVLRRLPERFERRSSTRRRVVRMLIASTVGVVVFVFALMAAGVGTVPPVSDEMIVRSLPDGHGRNVVNVILVDFRGLDTMAEISVLAVASIGAVALARAGR
ncbi:MAG: DUF4040 domain-containing protein, partial [Acidimicrobiia bacterium]|nr:DUF4040 domain-containing protein [Acidimicrobiia bacterium]